MSDNKITHKDILDRYNRITERNHSIHSSEKEHL
jgi:hypothetical protein